MSNLSFQSNLKSPLVLTATEPVKVEMKNYTIPKSTGVLVPSWDAVQALPVIAANVSLVNQNVKVSVTRMGKWQFAMVRVVFKFGTTAPTVSLGTIGLRMLDAELWNFSQKLYTQDADKLAGYLNSIPLAAKLAILQKTMVLTEATDEPLSYTVAGGVPAVDTAYSTYVPMLFPPFVNTRNNWDLEVLEPLVLKMRFNGAKHLGLVSTTTFLSVGGTNDISLITQTVDYEPEYKQALYLANFGTEGLNMPYFSFDSETQLTPLTSDTTTRVKLATTVPCSMNHFSIRILVPTASAIPVNFNIKSIDCFLNNRVYIQGVQLKAITIKAEMLCSANMTLIDPAATSGSLTMVVDRNEVSTIPWCERPYDRTSFSGCLAYGGINLPEFVLNYGTPTGGYALWESVIVSEFYSELLMNGQSGRIYSSIAS